MTQIATLIAELTRIHDEAVACLRADIAAYAADGTLPPAERAERRQRTDRKPSPSRRARAVLPLEAT